MAPWAAGLWERRRTCEGCRDLHQNRSVLAAVSGGGRAPHQQEPPSFGPRLEDLRICFEIRESRASAPLHIASQNMIVHCNMATLAYRVKNRTRNFAVINATLSRLMAEIGQRAVGATIYGRAEMT